MRGSMLMGLLFCYLSSAPPSSAAEARKPLPLRALFGLHAHHARSRIELSPDGAWVAHTYRTGELIGSGGESYTASGVPLSEGDDQMRAVLTNTNNGSEIILGSNGASSWAPVWSADGEKVAFYSDEGGEAGVWVWHKASGNSERFPNVLARPGMGFETIHWMSDGTHLLCKILSAGVSIAQANVGELNNREEPIRLANSTANQPSVYVLQSKHAAGSARSDSAKATPTSVNEVTTDLAILDMRTRKVVRIAEHVSPYWYSFSPNERLVAYTVWKGQEVNTQQDVFDLMAYEISSAEIRTLASNIRLSYGGNELNWSPDSKQIAYISNGQLADGGIAIISLNGSRVDIRGEGIPYFGAIFRPPLWAVDGGAIFALANDKLWRVDTTSHDVSPVGEIPGFIITGIVSHPDRSTPWVTDAGRRIWVVATQRKGNAGRIRSGIFSVDLSTGKNRTLFVDSQSRFALFNLDGNDATGQIAYVAKDQRHLPEVWKVGTRNGAVRQVSHLNKELENYLLGEARIIAWRGPDGQSLHGSLLLPPKWTSGQRLPLIVWVYGGSMGSQYVNSLGFNSDSPIFNLQVLATRGYAVLFPDSPLREGRQMQDLFNTVMPGVDAAIEQGYADPARLAVMGQSYGSYCVLALISQSNRFKAAIITAAVVHPDLFASYLEMSPDGTPDFIGYFEHGQGNMGGTPWERRDSYFDNSPLFQFDKILTPLLIGQGSKDGRLFASDAIFVGLQRLGKDVEYRIYKDEGHVMSGKANVIDFWNRRLDFLAENLDLRLDEAGAVIFDGNHAVSRKVTPKAASN